MSIMVHPHYLLIESVFYTFYIYFTLTFTMERDCIVAAVYFLSTLSSGVNQIVRETDLLIYSDMEQKNIYFL